MEFLALSETAEVKTVLYDANQPQTIKLSIEDGADIYELFHTYAPITNGRFFALEKEIADNLKRLKSYSMGFYEPKEKIAKELIQSTDGYEFETENWKDEIDVVHYTNAMKSYFLFEVLPPEPTTAKKFNPKGLIEVKAKTFQNGALIDVSLFFRRPTTEQRNKFLRIQTNEPESTNLASAVQKPQTQKLYELGLELFDKSTGYANDVPAWHLSKSVESFFISQLSNTTP